MTDDLATTGVQVVPVLALGAVIAYRARVRAQEQLLSPLSRSVKDWRSGCDARGQRRR